MFKGSVVVVLEGLFDKTAPDAEVKKRLSDTLTTVVVSGEIPVPQTENFDPLPTIPKALPQVTKIPDGKVCPNGQQLNDQGTCDACSVGTYQPTDVKNFCYECGVDRTTETTGAWGEKDAVCKKWCAPEISYCKNEGSCLFDAYTSKPICTCPDLYEGTHCDVRIDAYSKSQVPLIIGLVVGFFALFLVVMFIVASFGYRRRMREQKRKQRDSHHRESPPSMTPALPMPSAYSGYTPRNNTGTTAPWSQPGQFMFFNDDTDANDQRRYPYFASPSTVFQRS
ncbi:hypothetical protein LSAT2_005069 [Lamellibrachia satsuma]|nr:hypothetical protein LSAT2_005069 [Lamellibrachia satsuma]